MGSASALLNWQNVIGRFFGHVYILEWYYHTNFIAHDSLSSPPPLLENHSLILGLKEFWLYINLILYYYYSIPIICFWIMYSCPCGLLAHMVFSSFFQFNRIVNNVRYLGHHIFKALFLIFFLFSFYKKILVCKSLNFCQKKDKLANFFLFFLIIQPILYICFCLWLIISFFYYWIDVEWNTSRPSLYTRL